MITCIRTILLCSIFFFGFSEITLSQKNPFNDSTRFVPHEIIPENNRLFVPENKQTLRKVTNYRSTDWRKVIDTLWGPGLPTAEKLQIFDAFWDTTNQQFGGFPNLAINWDSMRTRYRPEVEAGVSKGRFYAIMTQLSMALQEMHTNVRDTEIDNTFFSDNNIRYWKRSKYWPVPGVPLSTAGGWEITSTGFGVSPLPDSSLLVYRAVPNNPLGIKAGDIVLGYEGKRWTRILDELDSIQMPWFFPLVGTSPEGFKYSKLNAAPLNWFLFDTIDIIQQSTGKTLHLSTKPLADARPGWDTLYCTDQLPVPGVPMPDVWRNNMISWGIIEGTSIGYIYVYSWATLTTQIWFATAVAELKNKTTGLIIDFRLVMGGYPNYANPGFAGLFNEDIDKYYELVHRSSLSDHFLFIHQSIASSWIGRFTPGNLIYDHPIAVLNGPACLSAGDYNAFRMRFHPMARSFGKRTNSAFVDGEASEGKLVKNSWEYAISKGGVYSNYNNEGYLIHKGFPVDEEVWLTQAGVVKGEDDVVKRAKEWITTLTYANSALADRPYVRPGIDTVSIKTILINPLNHQSKISAILTNPNGAVLDSALLFNDGLHGDGSAGDSVWGYRFLAPPDENMFTVTIRTDDITNGTYRRIPNVRLFITAGPLKLDSLGKRKLSSSYLVTPYIRNKGKKLSIGGATVNLKSNDPWVVSIAKSIPTLPVLPPDSTLPTDGPYSVKYDAATFPGYFNFTVDMSIDGIIYWSDSTKLVLTGVEENITSLPTVYSLEQNFPNPFNPSTTIRYSLPSSANVKLSVYDLLGREIATLVNEEQSAGWKEVQWNAGRVSSGIYFYKLTTGSFVEVKKMMVLK